MAEVLPSVRNVRTDQGPACERCRERVRSRHQYPVADYIVLVCDTCWRELTGRVYRAPFLG